MNMSNIVPEDEADRLKELLKKGLSGENKPFIMQRVRKDGKIVSVWITVTLMRDEKGQLEYIATTERDLSQLSTAALSNLTGEPHEKKGAKRNR